MNLLRTVFTTCALALLSLPTLAEDENGEENDEGIDYDGQVILGGGIDYSSLQMGPTETLTTINVEPTIGLYVSEDLLLDLKVGYTNFSNDDESTSVVSVGPNLQSYIYDLERIRFFVGGNLDVDIWDTEDDQPDIGPNIGLEALNPGVTFQATDWLAFDLVLNTGFYVSMAEVGNVDDFNVGFGSISNPVNDIGGEEVRLTPRSTIDGRFYINF